MKYLRFLAILLIFAILFSATSCKKDDDEEINAGDESGESTDKGGENDPDENLGMPDHIGDNGGSGDIDEGDEGTGDTDGDGGSVGNEGVEVTPDEVTTTYYYSVKSDRFHIAGCRYIDSIGAETLSTHEGSYDDMIAMGKIACSFCLSSDEDGSVTEEVIPEGTTYILNVKTKKVHDITCHSAKTISAENKAYSKLSSDELILLGYELCDNCTGKVPAIDPDVTVPEEGN